MYIYVKQWAGSEEIADIEIKRERGGEKKDHTGSKKKHTIFFKCADGWLEERQ